MERSEAAGSFVHLATGEPEPCPEATCDKNESLMGASVPSWSVRPVFICVMV